MDKSAPLNKTHKRRTIYDRYFNLCPICKKNKGKSKKFKSLYQLLYHLNIHDAIDEVAAGVTRDDVKMIVKYIESALELGMIT